MMLRKLDIAASWQRAREAFAALTSERDALARELAEIRRQRDEILATLRELQAAVQARWKAEEWVRELYRERDIQRAQRAERDPAMPLN
jgi:uncharacterized coiled-coil DUF342 family protein